MQTDVTLSPVATGCDVSPSGRFSPSNLAPVAQTGADCHGSKVAAVGQTEVSLNQFPASRCRAPTAYPEGQAYQRQALARLAG
jgi:hypothetical protein